MSLQPLATFLVAALVSALVSYPVLHLLTALKSRQTVSEHLGETHQVKQGTPTMGGLIIIPGLAIGLLGLGAGWWLALLGFALIGFIDDFVVPRMLKGKRGLGWKQKLAMELIFAVGAAYLCFGSQWDQVAGASFLILFCANAYNFADGLDALAGGLLLSLGIGLWVILGMLGQPQAGIFAAAVGAALPFLWFNAPPAKVFMGDVGALSIGAVLGLGIWQAGAGLAVSEPTYAIVAMLALAAILIVELVPVPLQILSVKLRGKRMFLRTPIHHAFEHVGIPETTIVWRFLIVQAVMSAFAVLMAYLALRSGGGEIWPFLMD